VFAGGIVNELGGLIGSCGHFVSIRPHKD
jgi:hypothetical protein